MADAQIKIALNKLSMFGVVVHQFDENGNDAGEPQAVKPGGSFTHSLEEGHSLVVQSGERAELPKGKAGEATVLTVSTEKDSTHNPTVILTSAGAELMRRDVASDQEQVFTLIESGSLRVVRGPKA